MPQPRHFLTLLDFTPSELAALIDRAIEMKREHSEGVDQRRFPSKIMAMVFEKSSTRTRVRLQISSVR